MSHYVSAEGLSKDLNQISLSLLNTVNEAGKSFSKLNERDWSAIVSTEKWSKKEILGHLIDSAANNHIRFIKAQLAKEEFVGVGYEQNFFVASQHYQDRNAADLIQLWTIYNLHIAHVIRHVDSSKLDIKCKIGDYEPVTLLFLIEDYIGHIKHHLKQILG